MKRVTAYVNTTRVHWLAEELVAAGVKEIRVIEHFSPMSQISRMQLCCKDELVDTVREIIRRLGTAGSPPDVDLVVSDFDPHAPSQIAVGKRMSVLEEPQLAGRIRALFKGATTRFTLIFLAITLSIGTVGLFTHFRLAQFQQASRASADNVRTVVNAANTIQTAHLEELLAAEQLHRGEGGKTVQDFKGARTRLGAAIKTLQESQLVPVAAIDSLVDIEGRFQSTSDGMFDVLTRLSNLHEIQNSAEQSKLAQSHAEIMASLDVLHRRCMTLLSSLERAVSEVAHANERENNNALDAIRFSLTLLAGVATIITVLIWFVTRRKVSQPLRILVKEARALDDGELK